MLVCRPQAPISWQPQPALLGPACAPWHAAALRRLERSLRPGATWGGLRDQSDRAMAAALEGAGLLRRGAAGDGAWRG